MSLVSHVALDTGGRGFGGATVEAFMPHPDLGGQIPHKTLRVCHHIQIRNEQAVGCAHMFEVLCETGVVACEGLIAEQALEGRCVLLIFAALYVTFILLVLLILVLFILPNSPNSPILVTTPVANRSAAYVDIWNLFLRLLMERTQSDRRQ